MMRKEMKWLSLRKYLRHEKADTMGEFEKVHRQNEERRERRLLRIEKETEK